MFKGEVIMGKRILLQGIIGGAIIGGIAALFNKDARRYAVEKLKETKDCLQNPVETVEKVKNTVDTISTTVATQAEGAKNALEQVGNTLNKITGNK